MLDEVIVTAQRKAENVQDVPISMTVFSEEHRAVRLHRHQVMAQAQAIFSIFKTFRY
jgi:hypothetical protein